MQPDGADEELAICQSTTSSLCDRTGYKKSDGSKYRALDTRSTTSQGNAELTRKRPVPITPPIETISESKAWRSRSAGPVRNHSPLSPPNFQATPPAASRLTHRNVSRLQASLEVSLLDTLRVGRDVEDIVGVVGVLLAIGKLLVVFDRGLHDGGRVK